MIYSCFEIDRRGLEWVVGGELNVQENTPSLVWRALWSRYESCLMKDIRLTDQGSITDV